MITDNDIKTLAKDIATFAESFVSCHAPKDFSEAARKDIEKYVADQLMRRLQNEQRG